MGTEIHPTAVVDPQAELGDGVVVGPFSVIGPNVKLGDGCRIGPHAVIEGRTSLGANCKVFQFASIGSAPQDLKFNNEPSTLEIGENNVIRESVTMNPGTEHGSMKTVVGSSNLFMVGSHVAHDCVVGSNNVFANIATLAGHVEIGSNVILGGLIAIHQFVRIGDYSILSGGTMVGLDVPPYCIAQGDRCRLRGINVIALKRANFDDEAVRDIRKLFRILSDGSAKADAFEKRVRERSPELLEKPYVVSFVDFVRNTNRGITTTSRHQAES